MEKKYLDEYKRKISQLTDKEKKLRDLYLKKIANGELYGPKVGYQSLDRPSLRFYDYDIEEVSIPKKSIYQMAYDSNKSNMNEIAIELRTSKNNFGKGIKISYKSFFQRVEQAAKGLLELGIKPNDIVPIILPNIPESRILIYALNKIGATVYPINFMISQNDLKKIIEENNIENIVIFEDFYGKFKEVIDDEKIKHIVHVNGLESLPEIAKIYMNHKQGRIQEDSRNYTYDTMIKNGKNRKETLPYYDENHVAVVIGTSGTTGTPKGVCFTDDALNAVAVQHDLAGLFGRGEKFLDVLIQSIGYGISAMHFSTCAGLKDILIPELVSTNIGELLYKIKPEHFLGGPIHCINIYNSKEYKSGKLNPIKNFVSGGASLDKELEMKLNGIDENYDETVEKESERKEIFVRQGLGATENCGCGTYTVKGSYKFGSVGIPLPLDNIAIFKLGTDEELTYNTPGEICISGPTIMREYLNNESETQKVLMRHSDGSYWIHLADIGYCDEYGRIYHTERAKNIFMRSGFNVHPSKISGYIKHFEAVKECCVLGFPDEKEQMTPKAFVELKDEYKNCDISDIEKSLNDFCYKNMDEYCIPSEWIFVEKMPYNLGGKIEEKRLKEIYEERKSSQKKRSLQK